MISFFVEGTPKALSVGTSRLGRRSRKTGRRSVYQGRRNNEWAEDIGRVAWKKYAGMVPWNGPIVMGVTVYVRRPKRQPTYAYPTVRPDIDNYIHKITDRFIGLFYHDDSQIVSLTAKKMYADDSGERPPGLCITVETI